MSYDITLQDVQETPVIFIRRRVDWEELAVALSEILPAVFQHALGAGLALSGPPFVRFVEQSAAFVVLEGGVPLAEPATAPDDSPVQSGTLPAGKAAVTIHTGPYEGLGAAQAAVERWIDAESLSIRAPMWFVYLTDPGEVPDPNEWQTQVLCPVV